MSQADVINVLEESKVPMSRDQIAKEINNEPVEVSKVLKILLKHNEIKCIEVDRYQAAKLLNWENPIRRTRFYYIELKLKEIRKWQG